MRCFFTGRGASQKQAVAAAVQVVHRLYREQHSEFLPPLVLGYRETEIQLAAPRDHVFEDLIDRVLVDAGPARDNAPDRPPDAIDELCGGHGVSKLRSIREQTAQIAIVEVRVV